MTLLQSSAISDVRVGFVGGKELYFRPVTLPHRPGDRVTFRQSYNQFGTLVRETSRYDCFGLVLGNRKGHLAPQFSGLRVDVLVREALESDGFARTSDRSQLVAGDVVIYSRGAGIDHIGLVAGFTDPIATKADGSGIMVISKFGGAGEYLHRIDSVPLRLFGTPTEYWILRLP